MSDTTPENRFTDPALHEAALALHSALDSDIAVAKMVMQCFREVETAELAGTMTKVVAQRRESALVVADYMIRNNDRRLRPDEAELFQLLLGVAVPLRRSVVKSEPVASVAPYPEIPPMGLRTFGLSSSDSGKPGLRGERYFQFRKAIGNYVGVDAYDASHVAHRLLRGHTLPQTLIVRAGDDGIVYKGFVQTEQDAREARKQIEKSRYSKAVLQVFRRLAEGVELNLSAVEPDSDI
jgi:hypothetical protein